MTDQVVNLLWLCLWFSGVATQGPGSHPVHARAGLLAVHGVNPFKQRLCLWCSGVATQGPGGHLMHARAGLLAVHGV